MNKPGIYAFLLIFCAFLSVAVVFAQTPASEHKNLQLSVQRDSAPLGSDIDLHIEIVPDHLSSVDIVLGVIRPDNKLFAYKGQGKGFSPFEGYDSAPPLVKDFPLTTAMTIVQFIPLPQDWPSGKYQFIAAVMNERTIVEIDHSNAFNVVKAQ
ncbi:MAG: hypothetical protein NTZ78_09075 [Candidatus Aureabacteria bacterium]|nr:hypothetical protein [Candidatus Auribacterota bacterium]